MKTEKISNRLGFLISVFLLLLISALIYLLFVRQFGYFNDDWYLMYAAGAKGSAAFKGIYIVDRPMRALIMGPLYLLLGNNPVLYNISAWGFRSLSAVFFFCFLTLLWPRQKKAVWMSALLYLIYPGFLSQFNGIDYQSQMVSLAVGMFSLVLLVLAYFSSDWPKRTAFFIFLIVTTMFYLGLVEYFIGMEVLKLAFVLVLVFRDETGWVGRTKKSILWMIYSLLALFPFLVWRLFFFHSERGATDVDTKFVDVLTDPIAFLMHWSSTLLRNSVDVFFWAWVKPLQRVSHQVTAQQWLFGLVIAVLILMFIWLAFKRNNIVQDELRKTKWRVEALWLGIVMLIFGLLPVILVGRSVDFRSFSRYALAPSIGVVLILQAGLASISNTWLRNILFALLVTSSSFTHYGNALFRVRETQQMNQFWWQVSWRIPQMQQGTTLLVNYPNITIEEDYFVWGPANLIYYPDSMNEDYPQPGIYSLLINNVTIEKVLADEKQDFNNRRSIRTYPNYRNILILTQPTSTSCVQVISGGQPEYSSFEDERILQIGSHSEVDQILVQETFHQPPQIPFGLEPEHTWCFYYEKAALARQLGDWNAVLKLADEAFDRGVSPVDQIEWMPFLQAYAVSNDLIRLREINNLLTDVSVRAQVCQILNGMTTLDQNTHSEINTLFCAQ